MPFAAPAAKPDPSATHRRVIPLRFFGGSPVTRSRGSRNFARTRAQAAVLQKQPYASSLG
jgi:hypothetical protein